jgi:tetratricopeptide (TPR) repeat protein
MGQFSQAQFALQEATRIFDELGDPSGAAWSINQQGDIAREQGDVPGARRLYQGALAIFRQTGDRWGAARSLADLASIDCEQGDHPAAHTRYREALEIFADLGHRRGIARVLEGSACLALARAQAAPALKLAAAAAHLRRQICAPLPPADQLKLDGVLQAAWESLDDENGKAAWEEGLAVSMEEAIQYCLQGTTAVT